MAESNNKTNALSVNDVRDISKGMVPKQWWHVISRNTPPSWGNIFVIIVFALGKLRKKQALTFTDSERWNRMRAHSAERTAGYTVLVYWFACF